MVALGETREANYLDKKGRRQIFLESKNNGEKKKKHQKKQKPKQNKNTFVVCSKTETE